MTYGLDFKPRTLRRLARSPYSPIEGAAVAVLRTDVLARLLLERLNSLGPMLETEACDVLDDRADLAGRGAEVVKYARVAGLVKRVEHDDGATLEAVGVPRSLAA